MRVTTFKQVSLSISLCKLLMVPYLCMYRACVLCLSPNHPLVKDCNLKVVCIDFLAGRFCQKYEKTKKISFLKLTLHEVNFVSVMYLQGTESNLKLYPLCCSL